ncbi:DUF2087 domain-containing protein [Streptomyces toxytricini]|uniref:DUF2087 domain-containing protein n=1 Tax=Streptomyces toxytricini TaxID=67369 RepID=A0ABW8EPZ4_STRT5
MPQEDEHRTRPPHTAPAPDSLSRFFADGRLTAVPRRPAVREALLAHLADTLFESGRAYTEPEVNDALGTVHEDTAALRRHLITSGLLDRTRDGSTYRRAAAAC